MSVTTKATAFASLGTRATAKITATLLSIANKKLAKLLGGELYSKYSASATADIISAIELGSTTKIIISSAHFRRSGSFVGISGITDNGLWQLNGRHQIDYVDGSSATKFTIPINSSDYESVAYTSGGEVIDGIWDEIEDAEAYLLLSVLIPACIDITPGDIGVIPNTQQWGEGSATKSYFDELQKYANRFYNMAVSIIQSNVGDGESSDGVLIIASS